MRYADAIDMADMEALCAYIFNELITSKKIEWDEYRIRIHPYEIDRYLPLL